MAIEEVTEWATVARENFSPHPTGPVGREAARVSLTTQELMGAIARWRDTLGGGGVITVEDEGTPLATAADTLNFVGNSVVASGTGTTKTITIADAAAAGSTDEIQYNVSGDFTASPNFKFIDNAFNPVLELGDELGNIFTPTIELRASTNGGGRIHFYENGTQRARMEFIPSVGGDVDVVRIVSNVGPVQIMPSNLVTGDFTGEGLELHKGGLKLTSQTSAPWVDELNHGQLYMKTSDGIPYWVNDVGAEFSIIDSGSIGGSITDNQIAVGAATANEIEGNASFTFDASTNELRLGTQVTGRIEMGGTAESIRWNNTLDTIDIYQDSQIVIGISGTQDVAMPWGNLRVGGTSAVNGVVSVRSSAATDALVDFYNGTTKYAELRLDNANLDLDIRTQVAGAEVAVYSGLGFEAMRWHGTNGDTAMGGYLTQYNGGTPTDTHVLTWVTANGRAEFSIIDTGSGISGTPANNELAVWVSATAIEGESNLTFDGTTFAITGDASVSGELEIEAYSEDANSYTVTVGTKDLDTSLATYFYAVSAMTAVAVDFTFSNPTATGRVTSFTLELNNMVANTDATPWPTSVDWAGGTEPTWTSGIDIVSFVTRDGGTTWYGFLGGLAFA